MISLYDYRNEKAMRIALEDSMNAVLEMLVYVDTKKCPDCIIKKFKSGLSEYYEIADNYIPYL